MQRRTALKGFVASKVATNFALVGKARATQARQHQIKILKFQFEPPTLDVKPGDQITWTNHDIVPHTATAMGGSWDTGHLEQGDSKTVTVTNSMAADYFCQYHPSMKAKLRLG